MSHNKRHPLELLPYLPECMVLLKSDGHFPIKDKKEISLFGNGARRTVKGGTGSGEVNSEYFINAEEGLKKAGFIIKNQEWMDQYEEIYVEARKQFVKDIKHKAKKARKHPVFMALGVIMKEPEHDIPLTFEGDTAIYILSRISGEGTDRTNERGDFLLTNKEINDILALNEYYENFILVLNTGGPVDLSEVINVKNILFISQLGVHLGDALANVLLGKASPSGKLATTWSRFSDYNIKEFAKEDDNRYLEGIYFGYRYFDASKNKPLFPFGFGLTYTSFDINLLDVSLNKSVVKINAKVKNAGKTYSAKEVVQVYLSKRTEGFNQAYQDLVAFKKSKELSPSEEENLSLSFDLLDNLTFDENRKAYVLLKGQYIVRIGNSSINNVPIAVINNPQDIVVKEVKTIMPSECGFKEDSYDFEKEELPKDIASFELDLKVETKKQTYKEVDILPEVKDLPLKDLILLTLGNFDFKGNLLSVVGVASKKVLGAAGETRDIANLPSLVMADGPAGVRLTKEYYEDKKGKHPLRQSIIPASIVEFLSPVLKKVLKVMTMERDNPPKGVETKYQYLTALPIATAIASSWNLDFAKLCGDIIGREMEIFNIDVWLAPAMNIHRCVLCGRNFEYYSEDPFLCGKMASNITQGVQSHKGKGVTLKHFAANNQETNRMCTNSIISERTFREIYLKGYEICIKEATPYALMSAYNLVNGEHISECKTILNGYLRNELDFQGLIMTDWVIKNKDNMKKKYRDSLAPFVIKGGGDIFMPGSKYDYQNIMKALKTNEITRTDIERSASQVIKNVRKLININTEK